MAEIKLTELGYDADWIKAGRRLEGNTRLIEKSSPCTRCMMWRGCKLNLQTVDSVPYIL